MSYIVLEIQKNAQGTIASIVTSYNNLQQAESAYYTVLSAAAISSLPLHGAILLDENGMIYSNKTYRHESEPVS